MSTFQRGETEERGEEPYGGLLRSASDAAGSGSCGRAPSPQQATSSSAARSTESGNGIMLHPSAVPEAPADFRLRAKRGDADIGVTPRARRDAHQPHVRG